MLVTLGACSREKDPPRAENQRNDLGLPGITSAVPHSAVDLKTPPIPNADAVLDLPRFQGGPRAVAGQHGLVVAVEARAARAGARVLEEGGNAVDAAVATLFALAVTHPSAASLGGGGFALVRARGTTTTAIDFVPTAPATLTRERFQRMIAAGAKGPEAVGVPGFVAGLSLLHQRFGSKPWKDLLDPAIVLASKGQPLPAHAARLLARAFVDLRADPAALKLFAAPGRPHGAGARFVQADLGWALEQIATHGADAFYRGSVGERLARALAPNGPSVADLAAYRAVIREPLRFSYRGFTLETMAPPSAGGVALAGTLLSALSVTPSPTPGSLEDVHVLLEAERRAQAERRFRVVDPDSLPESELLARNVRWQDDNYWKKSPIALGRATPSADVDPRKVPLPRESEHTTHVSIIDRDGMAVSLTTTLCASFGARVVAAGTGIVMNNAVATFAADGENQPTPSRRTTSSMAPTLLRAGPDLRAILGTPGGDTIPSTLAQIVRHLVDEGWSLDRAVEAPRWHHGFVPDEARYEPALASAKPLLKGLGARGHRLKVLGHRIGDANCIVLGDSRAFGYADSREPGVAVAAGR